MTRQRTLIIAEAGVNHNGELSLAKRLIDVAADAGADLVKFQTFNAKRIVIPNARKADYQLQGTDSAESQFEMLRRLELSDDDHRQLIDHCRQKNIGFFSTGFDVQSIDQLVRLGVRPFKIPSGEITNLSYLRHVGQYGSTVLLSTGMATMGEIEVAIDVLEAAGTPRSSIKVLHCTTEYPTPMSEVNLRAMRSISAAFGVDVGYSDHTQGIEVAVAAVALGASVIEKHFTLDRTLPGPDHKASLEPAELKAMVAAIRNIEMALGDGIKRPSQTEIRNRTVVRKSLVAARPIRAGEAFTSQNVTAKRPGSGLSPMLWDQVIGKIAVRDFDLDELIDL